MGDVVEGAAVERRLEVVQSNAKRPDLPGVQVTMRNGTSFVPTGTTAEGCEKFLEGLESGETKYISIDTVDGGIVYVAASEILIVNRISTAKLREVEDRDAAQRAAMAAKTAGITLAGPNGQR